MTQPASTPAMVMEQQSAVLPKRVLRLVVDRRLRRTYLCVALGLADGRITGEAAWRWSCVRLGERRDRDCRRAACGEQERGDKGSDIHWFGLSVSSSSG